MKRATPSSVCRSFPVAISKMLMMPSMAPLARYFPSGLCAGNTGDHKILCSASLLLAAGVTGWPANRTSDTPAAVNAEPAPRHTTGWKTEPRVREKWAKFPYICNTENEFSSRVQRIFLFPTFHTKNVHFPHMSSCGQILGIRRKGQSPGVH